MLQMRVALLYPQRVAVVVERHYLLECGNGGKVRGRCAKRVRLPIPHALIAESRIENGIVANARRVYPASLILHALMGDSHRDIEIPIVLYAFFGILLPADVERYDMVRCDVFIIVRIVRIDARSQHVSHRRKEAQWFVRRGRPVIQAVETKDIVMVRSAPVFRIVKKATRPAL